MSATLLLIAVDNWRLREAFNIFFGLHEDFEVVGTAANRSQTQSLCQQLTPQILLLEAEVVRHNPVGFIRALHEDFPALKIVVFVTHVNGLTADMVIEAGAVRFIGVNAFVSDILEVLREL